MSDMIDLITLFGITHERSDELFDVLEDIAVDRRSNEIRYHSAIEKFISMNDITELEKQFIMLMIGRMIEMENIDNHIESILNDKVIDEIKEEFFKKMN